MFKSILDTRSTCNCGIPDYTINRLQRIQSRAAHRVTITNQYDDITPILQTLYWMLIIQFQNIINNL